MKVLLDTNIWIDIAVRPHKFPESLELFCQLEHRHHTICLPLCAYTTIYYLLERSLGREAAVEYMDTLEKRAVRFLPFTEKEVSVARSLVFRDREDACIAATALNYRVEVIATRNSKDFKNSPVEAKSPKVLRQLEL